MSNYNFLVRAKDGGYVNLALARSLVVRFDSGSCKMTIVAIWQDGTNSYTDLCTEHDADAQSLLDRIVTLINGEVTNRAVERINTDLKRWSLSGGA